MSGLVSVSIEGEGRFTARRGQVLLDAALLNGFDLPQDCRAGHCGTCRVRVLSGAVRGGASGEAGAVLACQARLESDLAVAVEDVPEVETVHGVVTAVRPLAPDTVEVAIAPARPWTCLPGQYARFAFKGFPPRAFSPTVPLDGAADRGAIRLQVRRVGGGAVSPALGRAIAPGHRVRIEGPFGSAYLRPGSARPLVLVSGGTGFAPIWSIAHAALGEMPDRPLLVIAGARDPASLYFAPALLRLAAFPRVQVVPTVGRAGGRDAFALGSPADALPALAPDDVVHVCGAPGLVEAVALRAGAAGAACHADSFAPGCGLRPPDHRRRRGWSGWARPWRQGGLLAPTRPR